MQAQAFADDDKIPRLVEGLRARGALSFVAVHSERIVGHVMLSSGRLDAPERLVDVLTLSPLGIDPDHQRQGIGTELIEHALREADDRGVPLVFLEGDPRYYSLRGFDKASDLGFRSPSLRIPDAAFQVARLSAYEPWMTGTYVYSDIFWDLDCVGLR